MDAKHLALNQPATFYFYLNIINEAMSPDIDVIINKVLMAGRRRNLWIQLGGHPQERTFFHLDIECIDYEQKLCRVTFANMFFQNIVIKEDDPMPLYLALCEMELRIKQIVGM